MSDKPAVPHNAVGQPELHALVAEYGGHHKVPSEAWQAWDQANEQFQKRLRCFGSDVDELLAQLPTPPPSPFEPCANCDAEGHFGYRDAESGELLWFCREHRLGTWWADARR
jgi:hypothetical protein